MFIRVENFENYFIPLALLILTGLPSSSLNVLVELLGPQQLPSPKTPQHFSKNDGPYQN